MQRIISLKWWFLLTICLMLPALACEPSQEYERADLKGDDLSGLNFSFHNFVNFDFSGKNLQNVDFSYGQLDGANFSEADLTGAILDYADLADANFRDAILDEKWALIIDLLTTSNGAGRDLQGYDLSRTRLWAADLSNANLQNANLFGATLSFTNLSNANLSGANLQEANFEGANLFNTNFTNANLKNADFSRTDLTSVIVTSQQLGTAEFLCTRMPDGTIRNKESYCTPPTPLP